jgi:hypothetical protein
MKKRTSSVRLGRTGREEVGHGWAGKKNKGGGQAEIKKKYFQIKNWIFEFTKAWKFAQEDLAGILTWGFFLNSSRLLTDFRKIKYAMPCYATLGKIN